MERTSIELAMEKRDSHSCESCQHLSHSAFNNLSETELKCVDHQKVCNLYKKGQVLFHEGNRPMGVYCVKQGKIKIFKTSADGQEQIVRLAAPGDLVGYRAFLGDEHYTCTAATIEDAVVCFVDRNSFQKVMHENQKLSQNLLTLMSQELREAENMIRDMAQKSVRERLAEAIILLKNKFGMDPTEPDCLAAKFSREEWASFVGTATETAIRLLSELKSDGIIDTQGKKVRILNAKKLIEVANIVD